MAGTPHGLVDMKTAATTAAGWQETYVNVIRFLTSSQAALLGIQRIAYSTGSSTAGAVPLAVGTKDSYSDTGNGVGNNAWSVFRFLSASIPFTMIVQFSTGGTFGTVPGSPGAITTQNAGCGFQFAVRVDGGEAWNGTTNNNGADVKNFQVWTSGSSQLFVFPRGNGASGTYTSQKQQMMGPSGNSNGGPTINSRCHVIADQDNFLFLFDLGGDNSYSTLFFGKYTPRSGSNPPVPYLALFNSTETSDPTLPFSSYGGAPATSIDGGIAGQFPWLETRRCQLSSLNEFWTTNFQPNNNFATPEFDEFPIYVGSDEYPASGYFGILDYNFMRYVYNCATLDTNSAMTRAMFGNVTTGSTKISVPWGGGIAPGTNNNRSGTYF